MNWLTRRTFLARSGLLTVGLPWVGRPILNRARAATPLAAVDLRDRTRGLMYGSALGDALGGPLEFQPREAVQRLPDPPKVWRDEELLDAPARLAAAARLRLRSYADLRARPESYGPWNQESEPGTVTDDTRHKLILLHALRVADTQDAAVGSEELAQATLDWPARDAIRRHPDYPALAADWLEESNFAARWILGERDLAKARPPARLWQGLPTCYGQMSLLPLATLFAGQPERAYRAAYQLGFADNGFGKDLNAALVAGLAAALVTPVDPRDPAFAWTRVMTVLRETDPFGYARIRWTTRAVDRWLDLALRLARESAGRPARFFAALEQEFRSNTKWEAQVPFTVVFGCVALAEHDPLAALQLSLEWGHDTDSYAQLLGAFVGALHGTGIFPESWRRAVATRLKADFDHDLDEDCVLLDQLRRRGRTRAVIREE